MNDLRLLQEAASVAREDEDPRLRAVAVWLDTEALMHATITAAADRVDRESGGRSRLMVDDGGEFPTSTLPQAVGVACAILERHDQGDTELRGLPASMRERARVGGRPGSR